jgi:hypothetical protein
MRTFARTALFGVSLLAIAATAGAAGPPCGSPRNDAALLEQEREQVAWEAHNAKGVDKQELKAEESRLQWMIDELNRGGHVDPADVDRTLNRTY